MWLNDLHVRHVISKVKQMLFKIKVVQLLIKSQSTTIKFNINKCYRTLIKLIKCHAQNPNNKQPYTHNLPST